MAMVENAAYNQVNVPQVDTQTAQLSETLYETVLYFINNYIV